MFDNEFYPTPEPVVLQMIGSLELEGKVVLEPHAGKGDIVKIVKAQGAEVLVCEKNEDLAKISSSFADRFLCNDFFDLTSDMVSHVDYIIMNPPFSNANKHILHAWEIAPGGCQIIALCNYTALEYRYSANNLQSLVRDYGNKENIGDAFSTDAERKTDVEIGLVNLFKEKVGNTEFEDYFDMDECEEQDGKGIQKYNEIRSIVNRYIGAVALFDEVQAASGRINEMASGFSGHCSIQFGAHKRGDNNTFTTITRDVYKKDLQKAAWYTVFKKMKMDKYVTQSVKDKLNEFVEKQTSVPFKMSNVYKMMEVIVGTYSSNMDESLVKLFDKATQHYHENRYGVEGWKTNEQWGVNKTIILPRITEVGYSGQFGVHYQGHSVDLMNDLTKALCYMTGKNYEDYQTLQEFARGTNRPLKWYLTNEILVSKYGHSFDNMVKQHGAPKTGVTREEAIRKRCTTDFENKTESVTPEFGKKYDWGFFTVVGYKKDTMHFKFKDLKVWEQLNLTVGRLKGYPLPEMSSKHTKGNTTPATV